MSSIFSIMDEKSFIQQLYNQHRSTRPGIHLSTVGALANGLMKLIFPALCDKVYQNEDDFTVDFLQIKTDLFQLLKKLPNPKTPIKEIQHQFIESLPALIKELEADADAILAGDPAAVDRVEVIRTYPGFYAIAIYRIAHRFCSLGTDYLPRMLTEYAHNKTGIDIHPSAKIGPRFCIDHGTGVVIGETVEIGADVKLYQGVTLGALSVSKEMAKTKRHPTIGDRVLIYANATILGGETNIGSDSIIGGNVWITKSVPDGSRVYYREGKEKVIIEQKR